MRMSHWSSDVCSSDLAAAADELLAQMANHPIADRVKPEITRSMIDLNSSVHEHPMGLLAEMREMRDARCDAADAVGIPVAGGGAHPFTRWQDRQRGGEGKGVSVSVRIGGVRL